MNDYTHKYGYRSFNGKTSRSRRYVGADCIDTNNKPLPCRVISNQRVLLSSGKYKMVDELSSSDDVIDARGVARRVISNIPSRNTYVSYIQTKKSRNPIAISIDNRILVEDENNISTWIPIQEITRENHIIYSIPMPRSSIQSLNTSHPRSQNTSHPQTYARGFLLGAFMTCGCRRFDDTDTWIQFILDADKTYFESLLFLCLYSLYAEQRTFGISSYTPSDIENSRSRIGGVKNIENAWYRKYTDFSEIKKINCFSKCLDEVVSQIDEGRRELPVTYLAFDMMFLRGLYDSFLHTNHYFSDSSLYDLCVHIEAMIAYENVDDQMRRRMRKRGEITDIQCIRRNEKDENLVCTRTDEDFTSLICDHIPVATFV